MKKLLFVFFILITTSCFCQVEKNYLPVNITDTIPSQLYTQMQLRLKQDKAKIKSAGEKRDACNYKCELFEKQTEYVIDLFNDDFFMIDSTFTFFLNKIQDKIYEANPSLKKETRIYAFRSEIPNAFCVGEGTIGFNLGLLTRMENESQVAFIICHELAHYHLRHAEKKITKLTFLNFDKELKKEIEKIKEGKYNKYSKLKDLMHGLTFDVTKHSRSGENEADSMGLNYLINTTYNPLAAVRAMEILDSSDAPLYKNNINFKKYFNSAKYPFKDSWLEYDTLNFVYKKHETVDTMRTHPDCKKRIKFLQVQLNNNSRVKKGLAPPDNNLYKEMMIKSEFETIESEYQFKELGSALYKSLSLLEKYPENAYLHAIVGKCFYEIYYYQSIKEFGRVVEMPDNRNTFSYNQFLAFIHNLRFAEVGKIGQNYVEERATKFGDDQEFLYAMYLNSKIPASALDKTLITNKYKEKFPAGKYIKKVNTIPSTLKK